MLLALAGHLAQGARLEMGTPRVDDPEQARQDDGRSSMTKSMGHEQAIRTHAHPKVTFPSQEGHGGVTGDAHIGSLNHAT
jgi:hypothetical protein